MKKNSIRLKQCKECEQLFYAPRGRTVCYCSEKCHKEARRNQQILSRQKHIRTRKCKVCYAEFKPSKHNKKYCSTKCSLKGARQMNLAKKERYKKIAPHLVHNNDIHITNLTDWSHRRELQIVKQIKQMELIK